MIILPVPITRDNIHINGTKNINFKEITFENFKNKKIFLGSPTKEVKKMFSEQSLEYTDYSANISLATLNAVPTAEGAISVIIENTKTTVQGMNILITGYGKVAKPLAEKLQLLGASITIVARKNEQISQAISKGYTAVNYNFLPNIRKQFDVIINTPNAPIFSENIVKNIDSETIFIELASLPGGFDFNTKPYKNIIYALGLPGKYAPKSAGEYIGKIIIQQLKELKESSYEA